ncbi:hypothetical protein LJB42_002589 [Komagataella kurtzmanii]|nr:hypothetical protein LJB42_002589 [Komagataella kurtzmanii]
MVKPPCKFYQQGRCNKGNACNFSHILTNNSSTLNAKVQEIENDLGDTSSFQLTPLCSSLGYGTVSLIPNRDYSFEELRLEFYQQRDINRLDLYQHMLNARKLDMDRCLQTVRSDTQRAARYVLESKENNSLSPIINWEVNLTDGPSTSWGQNQNQHKGGGIFGNFSAVTNNNNVAANPFGASAASSSLATKNTGAFGAFGGAANATSSAFGAAARTTNSAFGSTSFDTSYKNTAFGGQSFGKSAFGGTSGGSGAFGAFAKAANPVNPGNSTNTSAFRASATGNPNSSFGSSGFGNTQSPAFGSTGFGSSGSPAFGSTGFGSTGSPAFGSTGFGSTGSPAFGSTGFGSPAKSPFAAAAGTTAQLSTSNSQNAFGSKASPFASSTAQPQIESFNSGSPFGSIANKNNAFSSAPAVASSSSPFGSTTNQDPFAQPTNNNNVFGSNPQHSAFANSPAITSSQNQKRAFSAQLQQNPFGGTSSFNGSNTLNLQSPSTNLTGPKHVYTDQETLPAETLRLFKEAFRLGTVPECPPPIELC